MVSDPGIPGTPVVLIREITDGAGKRAADRKGQYPALCSYITIHIALFLISNLFIFVAVFKRKKHV